MFNFNPYQSQTHSTRPPLDFATLQKARRDLIGEIQAVIDYDEHIHTSDDIVASQVWQSIKNEELVHIGELLALLDYLDSSQNQYVTKGIDEFNSMLNH